MFRRKPAPDTIGGGHQFADENMRHSTIWSMCRLSKSATCSKDAAVPVIPMRQCSNMVEPEPICSVVDGDARAAPDL